MFSYLCVNFTSLSTHYYFSNDGWHRYSSSNRHIQTDQRSTVVVERDFISIYDHILAHIPFYTMQHYDDFKLFLLFHMVLGVNFAFKHGYMAKALLLSHVYFFEERYLLFTYSFDIYVLALRWKDYIMLSFYECAVLYYKLSEISRIYLFINNFYHGTSNKTIFLHIKYQQLNSI